MPRKNRDLVERTECKRLMLDTDDDEENDGTVSTAEAHLAKRSLDRRLFYHRISIAVLSILLVLSILSNDSFSFWKESEHMVIASPVPLFSTLQTTFEQSPLLSQRPNTDSDAAWNALLPAGRGFVFVPNFEDYSLPRGEDTPYGPIYSTTVFHQLHCLGQLRRFSWMFLDTIITNNTAGAAAIEKMFVQGDAEEHLTHCFDYLRQGLMCNADMSLEWPRTEKDGRRFAVDGWDIPHECKNWDEVMEFMEENHFNMSTNAEIAPLHGAVG